MVSHGNAIRSLMKYIEKIPDEKVKDIEMLFGAVVTYELDNDGYVMTKDVKAVNSKINA